MHEGGAVSSFRFVMPQTSTFGASNRTRRMGHFARAPRDATWSSLSVLPSGCPRGRGRRC